MKRVCSSWTPLLESSTWLAHWTMKRSSITSLLSVRKMGEANLLPSECISIYWTSMITHQCSAWPHTAHLWWRTCLQDLLFSTSVSLMQMMVGVSSYSVSLMISTCFTLATHSKTRKGKFRLSLGCHHVLKFTACFVNRGCFSHISH